MVDGCNWDYGISSGPFLTMNFEFDQDDGLRPGPKLDNSLDLNLRLYNCLKTNSLPHLQDESTCYLIRFY